MANNTVAPEAPQVVSQAGALVGDEAVQAKTHTVEPEVNTDGVAAQVAPEREAQAGGVPVHETVVHTDRVITDPSSPEAVQIPDAGRGDASLPIHGLGGQTPEQVFASGDSEPVEQRAPFTPSSSDSGSDNS